MMPRQSLIPAQPTGYPIVAGITGLWSVVKEDNTVVNLNSYGLMITGYQGAGQNPFNNVRSQLGLSGGSFYQRTVDTERTINLVCVLQNPSFYRIQNIRQQIINLLTHDSLTQTAKNLKLRFQQVNNCGVATGIVLDCPVIFNGGLGGDVAGLFEDRFALQFLELTPPSIVETATNTITFSGAQNTFSTASPSVWERNSGGVWTNSYSSAGVRSIAENAAGTLLVGQALAVVHAIAGTTVTNNNVNAVAFDAAGNYYAGGDFTTPQTRFMRNLGAGFVSAGGATWNGSINCLTKMPDGNIMVGGAFTLPTSFLEIFDTVANTNTGILGPDALVRCAKFGPDGYWYIGGDFINTGLTVASNRIVRIKLNGTSITASGNLSTGMNGSVYDIAFKRNGNVIAVGSFTTSGGITTNGVAEWDGTSWKAVGVFPSGLTVYKVAVDSADRIHVSFLTGYRIYNGSTWVFGDLVAATNTAANCLVFIRGNGNLMVSATTGSYIKLATVTYTGTAPAYLTFTLTPSAITTPAYLCQIVNYTTGKIIYFNVANTAASQILATETVTLTVSPNGITFTSSFRGNILADILPGSDLANFGLKPNSSNVLGLFIYNVTAGTFQATYKNTHNSFDASAA